MRKFFVSLIIFAGLTSTQAYSGQIQKQYINLKKIVTTKTIEDLEMRSINEINKIREQHGLIPLKNWKELSECARKHSQDMASDTVPFGHQGFDDRAKKMMRLGNLRHFGENVAYNYGYKDPVMTAVDDWMHSPGHRDNILGDYNETGFGVAISSDGTYYATQLFAKGRKSSSPKVNINPEIKK